MPDVRVSQLSMQFSGVSVLNDISFTIDDGEFFTLLGPSGCGKSTTLNCIAGLEQPTAGEIMVGDTTFVDVAGKVYVPPEERNLGMVFQSYALWPHMTVEKNLALPLTIRKASKDEKSTLINDALDKVGLSHLKDRYPHQLSGGQQQRVALARALVYSPSVLLLDEPLSNLDAKLREQARAWLKRLQEDLGITTVYVTHDQDEALSLSDRIAVMFDGRMTQIDSPTEVYQRPASAHVAAFVGSCNFLVGVVEGQDDKTVGVRLETTGALIKVATTEKFVIGQEATVAVRPEQLTIASAGVPVTKVNILDTEVVTRAYVGSRYEYGLRLGTTIVQAITLDGSLFGKVRLVFDPEDALVYPDISIPSAEAQELMTVKS